MGEVRRHWDPGAVPSRDGPHPATEALVLAAKATGRSSRVSGLPFVFRVIEGLGLDRPWVWSGRGRRRRTADPRAEIQVMGVSGGLPQACPPGRVVSPPGQGSSAESPGCPGGDPAPLLIGTWQLQATGLAEQDARHPKPGSWAQSAPPAP